jgi:chromate reductase
MTDRPAIQVLAICGSLRAASFNRMAMQAAIAAAPQGMTISEGEIADLPLYNEDLRQRGDPTAVARLKAQVKAADALLFVTPEYNYGLPGVLKNAIDWVSRPPSTTPFDGKPVAMMGASTSLMGTVRGQMQLRQACLALNMHPINTPQVMIAQAETRFGADGALNDEVTAKFIGQLMHALYDLTLRLEARCLDRQVMAAPDGPRPGPMERGRQASASPQGPPGASQPIDMTSKGDTP